MLLQKCESFMLDLGDMVAFMQALEERRSQILNEVDLVKIITKVEDDRDAHSKNAVDSLKTMEVEGKHHAHFQN
jgi:hypothetical protein